MTAHIGSKRAVISVILLVLILNGTSTNMKSYTPKEDVLIKDDFEEYSVGVFPSAGGWILKFNGKGDQYQKIVDSVSASGSKSFQLWGRSPDWAACAMKELTTDSDILGYEVFVRAEELGTDLHIAYVEAVP